MNKEEFVAALQRHVSEPIIQDLIRALSKPPGRRPRPWLKELSNWYNSASDVEKERIKNVG